MREAYGKGMRRFFFFMLANCFVFAVTSNRNQHEFFEAIVLARNTLHVCSSLSDSVVERAFTSSPYRKKHLSQKAQAQARGIAGRSYRHLVASCTPYLSPACPAKPSHSINNSPHSLPIAGHTFSLSSGSSVHTNIRPALAIRSNMSQILPSHSCYRSWNRRQQQRCISGK
jgi:hypothetical protein